MLYNSVTTSTRTHYELDSPGGCGLNFKYMSLIEYDILITGLRTMRKREYDNYTRAKAGELLMIVMKAKREFLRRPHEHH